MTRRNSDRAAPWTRRRGGVRTSIPAAFQASRPVNPRRFRADKQEPEWSCQSAHVSDPLLRKEETPAHLRRACALCLDVNVEGSVYFASFMKASVNSGPWRFFTEANLKPRARTRAVTKLNKP